jgi:ATP-dependent DNA ligase
VQLWSRNGRDWTAELVAIAAALRDLPGDFVIDGEAVAHCEAGLPDFHRLMARGWPGECLASTPSTSCTSGARICARSSSPTAAVS